MAKLEANPIGSTFKGVLDTQINEIISNWETNKPKTSWWSRAKGAWVGAVRYLVAATDYFIRNVEGAILTGPDKKATVLDALGKVYDSIVPGFLPIFLSPFNSKIKSFVVGVVCSLMIDFIVSKYREGVWGTTEPTQPQQSTEVPNAQL